MWPVFLVLAAGGTYVGFEYHQEIFSLVQNILQSVIDGDDFPEISSPAPFDPRDLKYK